MGQVSACLFGIVLHFITFHHFFAISSKEENRQTTVL